MRASPEPRPGPPDPRRLAESLCAWFPGVARDLPWRVEASDGSGGRRDPYAVLVSELMLQQTQVSRVLEKFEPFLARFPTVRALAEAEEHEVLASWSGLGYYRRARLLHASARAIMDRHGGHVPPDPGALLALPGVGAYTAGAVASLAFGLPEPIVDGNVSRVLMRLHARPGNAGQRDVQAWCWERAGELVRVAEDPAVLNESMMELGATVCTPRGPGCDRCPLREMCLASATGAQEDIPEPKPKAKQRELFASSVLVRDGKGRLLVERRGSEGLWAGLHQAPTLERDDRPPTMPELEAGLGLADLVHVRDFTHQTTHRLVRFRVYEGREAAKACREPGRRYMTPSEIESVAISNAQRRILLGEGPAR